MEKFEPAEYEGEDHVLFTFEGLPGYYCISLNGSCIHAVRTLRVHKARLKALIEEFNLQKV